MCSSVVAACAVRGKSMGTAGDSAAWDDGVDGAWAGALFTEELMR